MAVEWWVVLATVIGPVVAVQTQKVIERATERKRTRRWIFHALMSNRATRLNDEYIRALNLIDLEFSPRRLGGSKDKAVINAWRALFGEYSHGRSENRTPEEQSAGNRRMDNCLVALLLAMSAALGYSFSEEELRRGIYYPQGRVDVEESQLIVLHGLRLLLQGQLAIPMKVTEFPSSPELTAAQIAMAERAANAYDDEGALRVRMLGGRAKK